MIRDQTSYRLYPSGCSSYSYKGGLFQATQLMTIPISGVLFFRAECRGIVRAILKTG